MSECLQCKVPRLRRSCDVPVRTRSTTANRDDRRFDEAAARGVDLPEGRGRLPVWVDVNQDGWLDVALTNRARSDGLAPTALLISVSTRSPPHGCATMFR